jgi:hypothetical protein
MFVWLSKGRRCGVELRVLDFAALSALFAHQHTERTVKPYSNDISSGVTHPSALLGTR